MPQLMFKVLHSAIKAPVGPVPSMTDPTPVYTGAGQPFEGRTFSLSGAIVTPGRKVGKTWMGCTYLKPPYDIPGFGEIEEMGF
jgi:hypothetical protein